MLTGEGTVYALGDNECGKLGVGRGGDELQMTNTPIKVDSLHNIAQVAVGDSHSIALTRDFKVYGWGQAEYGAIGMRLSNAKVPNEIKVLPERAGAKVKFANDDPSLT